MLPRIRHHLDGPPPVLPGWLDRLAERWWRARPRTRTALGLLAGTSVILAGITHAAASPHGPPVRVYVAARDLGIGEIVTASEVRQATWPADLVPEGAATAPHGAVVAPLPRGAVLTDRHLGSGGIAAGLPSGTVAVAIPIDALPELTTGTRLDLVGAGSDGGGTRLAADAVVLAIDATSVWIAVQRSAAVEITAAVASGTIAVIVLPP